MIPSDLAARLQLLTDTSLLNTGQSVQGLPRTREIQSRLPDLVPGNRFFATLQRALPDGTFRAVVAGQQMTLSLDKSAQAGDTLELVVTESSPRAIFAKIVNPDTAPNPQANASFQALLSPTARLISFLLTGQPAPEPVRLSGNRPLLDAPPLSNTQLAPALRQAISQSGLFYESHLAEWATGKHDLSSLLKEPQGQQPASTQTVTTTEGSNRTAPLASAHTGSQLPSSPLSHTPSTPSSPPSSGQNTATSTTPPPLPLRTETVRVAPQEEAISDSARPSILPERLLPVLHQQLEALGTQQYVWQGQIWPGQHMEWLIEDPRDGQNGQDEQEALREWNTTLRIKLPHVGALEAQIHLTPAGMALRLNVNDPASAALLNAEQPQLEEALAAAGIPLTGMVIEQQNESHA